MGGEKWQLEGECLVKKDAQEVLYKSTSSSSELPLLATMTIPVGATFSTRPMPFYWVCVGSSESPCPTVALAVHFPSSYFTQLLWGLLNSFLTSLVDSFPCPLSVRMSGFPFLLMFSPHLSLQINIKLWLETKPHSWLLSSNFLQESTPWSAGTQTHLITWEHLFSHEAPLSSCFQCSQFP